MPSLLSLLSPELSTAIDSTATSGANCDKTSIRQNFVPDNATATKFQLRQHKFVSKIDNYKSVMDQRTTVFICMASSYTQNTTTIEQCRCEHPYVCAQNFRKAVPLTVTIDSKVALSPDGVVVSAACNNVVVRYCTTGYSSIMIRVVVNIYCLVLDRLFAIYYFNLRFHSNAIHIAIRALFPIQILGHIGDCSSLLSYLEHWADKTQPFLLRKTSILLIDHWTLSHFLCRNR